jgi:large subunit ribosomal protein L6e
MPRDKARNPALSKGVRTMSRRALAQATQRWKHYKVVNAPNDKTVAPKASRFYPADDEKTPLNRNFTPGTAKLRSSITPGTVLIVLAGPYKGRRVVFLKQLPSGLLLVTGPYELNGCPLRRMNQAYVIATSTKLDVAAAVPDVDDSFFKRPKKTRRAKGEDGFFDNSASKATVSDERKAMQATVDGSILGGLDDDVKAYLQARFSLSSGDRPHEMSF